MLNVNTEEIFFSCKLGKDQLYTVIHIVSLQTSVQTNKLMKVTQNTDKPFWTYSANLLHGLVNALSLLESNCFSALPKLWEK